MNTSFIRLCAVLLFAIICSNVYAQAPAFSNDQYKKAIWMTTRMYGGQRSGEGPNWLIMDHTVSAADAADLTSAKAYVASKMTKGECFTDDADGAYSLSGGWVDCGDHVKFGQTMFYAGYMLALAYSEFPAGFDDYYSWDYNGYMTSGNFTWEGKNGKPNGIPDILDELKYETDFFIKCARNETTFYSQVGNGSLDHQNWVTSVAMAALPKKEGGQADGSREIVKNPEDCAMPAMCAATLAVMSRVYRVFDPAYADLCLVHANYAYKYASTKKGKTVGAPGFYDPKPDWADSYAIMLAEMYRATNTASFKTEALTYNTKIRNHNWSLCYNNCDDLAAYLLGTFGDATSKTLLMTLVNGYITDANSKKQYQRGPAWGKLRYTASQAFSTALLAKLNGDAGVNPYTAATIDFIMGDNTPGFSYIVGFGTNCAKRPHHRNYYQSDNLKAEQNTMPFPAKNAQHGYLVGGTLDPATYKDLTKDYTYTEGGIDYNAGLVGALAYINSIVSPVDINKFGHPTPKLGDAKSLCGTGSALLTATVDLSSLKSGESVTYKWYKSTATTPFEQGDTKTSVTVTTADTYRCDLIEKGGAWTTSGSVVVTATLPAVSLGADIELCETSSKLLDAGVTGTGINYTWKKNAVAITGATKNAYTVYNAGTYSVTVSASGCASQTDEIKITSLLPVVNYDTLCSAGIASLAVTTPGTYKWYDVTSGGTSLSDVATYSPNITVNKTFYVQDASSLAVTTGPKTTTFTGPGVNWGNIGAKFTAKAAFKITEITFKPFAMYNSDPVSITVKLTKGGVTVATYTSATATNAGLANYTLKFTTPIDVPSAGDYTLEPTAGLSVLFYESGPVYSTYNNYANIVEFNGATNGTASNNPFPAMFDWKISAGSTCARTPVFAVIDPASTTCGQSTMVTQTISLVKGWNFIGVGVELSNYSLASVFGTNMSKITSIKNADGFYSSAQPAYLNSLSVMKPGYGYFVYASAAVSFSITGKELATVSVPVKAGWNMISYPYKGTAAISTGLSSVWTKTLSVKNFEGFNIKGGSANNLDMLEFGEGYMLNLSTNGILLY